jgi:uncharacterized protein (TIGR00661 family)
VRIVYGVQSTGRGHLSRLLGLKPLFDRDGHELFVIISGYYDPPDYVFDALADVRTECFRGLSMVEDGAGGVSKRGTMKAFAGHLPGLFESFYRAHGMISEFNPDLIVSDFDPITGSPFVAPGTFKVGIGNEAILSHAAAVRPPKARLDRLNVNVIRKLFTSGVDVLLGCHFYPLDESCLPPILRPEVPSAVVENHGHLVVYHAFRGLLAPILDYAKRHSDRSIIIYGDSPPTPPSPENVRYECDPTRFIEDLATCDAYVGTAGFQSICEAFFFGKKIVVQPIASQYEQLWNAAQLEMHGMGRWFRGDLENDLSQPFNQTLLRRLAPWYREGARVCYDRILSYAKQDDRSDRRQPDPTSTGFHSAAP